jgi:predicted nucleotidyltransferase
MTKISRAGTNIALRVLSAYGYLECDKQGRMRFYRLAKNNYLVRQCRVLHLLEKMHGLLNKLRPLSEKAVLFGSEAKGVSNEESDIDLLIISREDGKVRQIINGSEFVEKISPIIKSPVEMITLKNSNKELAKSIEEGIVLWEETTN